MYAFSRESNVQFRSVLIEKNNNLEIPLFYEVENYDTVEVIRGNVKTKGFLSGIAYRSSNVENKNWPHNWVGNIDNIEDYSNVVGYASVTLFCMNAITGEISEQYISDYVRRRRRRGIGQYTEEQSSIFVYIIPCRMVLIEKNLIEKYEEFSKEAERRFQINYPFPLGG